MCYVLNTIYVHYLTLPVMYEVGGIIPILQPRKLRLRSLVNLPTSKSGALVDSVPSLKSDRKHCVLSTQKPTGTHNKLCIAFKL